MPSFDQAFAALITDLDERGMLDETLVTVSSEFGRTPMINNRAGRDHWPKVFSVAMAGGGVKGGFSYGATDEHGYEAVEGRTHIHDWHATILHLLGLDHTKLTYPHAGRNSRLTDVHGVVAKDIIA